MSNTVEKRQFGRRRSDIRGAAIVAKDQPKPFTILDLSEGGALVAFDDKTFSPERSFRILIDGTTMILLCEVRHRSKAGVGVRFMRPSEGVELNRLLHAKPVEVCAAVGAEVPRRHHPAAPSVRGRDLRASLHIVHTAAEIAAETHHTDARPTSRSPIAAGLARFRTVITRQNHLPHPEASISAEDGDRIAPRR